MNFDSFLELLKQSNFDVGYLAVIKDWYSRVCDFSSCDSLRKEYYYQLRGVLVATSALNLITEDDCDKITKELSDIYIKGLVVGLENV